MAEAPRRIGRYSLVRRVGVGGMGIVYEARDTRDDARLALKVLLPHAAEEEDGLLRFKREYRALARLHHPNIVRVYDSGIEDDVPYIAMELLDGRNVREHLEAMAPGPSRTKELRRCLAQVFGALAYIHARRIVHRDLKPENVFVCRDGRVKLMDFGVARLLRVPTVSGAGASNLLGTFAYMAPEQVTGAEVDGRADLYAIGVWLYEALVGSYPFPVEPPAAALHHHINTDPLPVRAQAPDADPKLATLCHRLLEKDPLDRVQSADEALALLAEESRPAEAHAGGAAASGEAGPPGALSSPRFVGRAGALGALERIVARTAQGAGSALLIEGATGLGKSRLVQELRRRHKHAINIVAGACAPERTQPYQPFRTILEDVEAILARARPDIAGKILGRDGGLVHALCPSLARRAPAAPDVQQLDPAERRIRQHKAVIGLIGRLALTRPVVLVVEDVHFADAGTREVLWSAARTFLQPRRDGRPGTVCPVSMVLTRRSRAEGTDHAEALLRRLEALGLLAREQLVPLNADEVAYMVRSMTGVEAVAAAPLAALMELTGGRPLLVSEHLEGWVADGTLARDRNGQWLYKGRPLQVSKALEDAGPPARPTGRPRQASAAPGGPDPP